LEIFEETPDDVANWGDAVSLEEKLYKSPSDEDDSEDEILSDEEKKGYLRFPGMKNAISGRKSAYGNKSYEKFRPLNKLNFQVGPKVEKRFKSLKKK